MMDTKQFAPPEVKFDDDAGTVEAVFASFDVKDSDNDVTRPGFFGKQSVAIAWAHDRSRLVGKGTIFESGKYAVLKGQFFLDTQEGREAYLTTKAMGDLQEWSYGFYLKEGGYSFGQFDGQQVRFLQPLPDGSPGVKVAEVSPVLVGAGIGTHTAMIKSDGLRFVDQAEQVAKAAELLFSRAEDIAQLRAEKGKALGDEAVARLLDVKTRLESVATMMSDLLATPDVKEPDTIPMFPDIMTVERTLADAQRLLEADR